MKTTNALEFLKMEQKPDLDALRKTQMEIAAKVKLEDSFTAPIKFVTGFDLTFLDEGAIVAAVTLNSKTLQIVEEKAIREKTPFPYIPTFLSFREGPLIIELIEMLKVKPDVLMLDSQGIAHPLFCGCACHVGVMVNKPSIGVAKTKLCGEYTQIPSRIGECSPLIYQGRTVGAVLLSKRHCNPLFISPGHMITLKTAVNIVNHFLAGYKIPEPTRLAHNLANKIKRHLL